MNSSGMLGFMELFIVLAFALGWAILELVTLRMDKRRQERAQRERSSETP
jgi:hypothetical protein